MPAMYRQLSPRRWSMAGLLLAALGAALWGLAPVAAKGALTVCTPEFISLIRLGGSTIIFWLLAGRCAVLVADRWVWISGVALGVDFFLYHQGLQHTTAAVAGLLVNVEPVATIGLAAWLLREKLHPHRLVGCILTLAGVTVVSSDGFDLRAMIATGHWRGNLLVIGAALAGSVYAVAQRRSRIGRTVFHRLAPIFLVATLTSLPPLVRPGAWVFGTDTSGWFLLGVLTLLCTCSVYIVYARAQQLVEVSALAVLLSSIPLFSLFFARIVLGERLSSPVLAGAALVITGIVVIALEPGLADDTTPLDPESAQRRWQADGLTAVRNERQASVDRAPRHR